VSTHRCTCSPREVTSRCSHKLLPCGLSTECVHLLRLFLLLLLLLLSHFSRVRLCATPETAAHQAPPSLGFSRQEHWSGLPFPSPKPETLLGLPCEPIQGVPRTPVQGCCPGACEEGARESQRQSLLFSLKTITSRTRTGDVKCWGLLGLHSTVRP